MRPCRQPTSAESQAGFTLSEVLVAAFVAAILLAAIGSLMLQVRHVSKMTAQSTIAMELAQSKMEEMLLGDWTGATSGSESHSPYTVLWSVSSQPPLSFRLDVTTRWHDLRNITHQVHVTSMTMTNVPLDFGLTPFNLPPIYE